MVIHHCPNLETTKVCFGKWMDKWTVVHPDNRTLLFQKVRAIKPWKTWEKLKHMLLSERSQSEKATSYMISTIRCPRKGKTMDTVKSSEFASGWGHEEGCKGWVQRTLRQWQYPVWYHSEGYVIKDNLSKSTECTPPQADGNVNHGLGVLTRRVSVVHQFYQMCHFGDGEAMPPQGNMRNRCTFPSILS